MIVMDCRGEERSRGGGLALMWKENSTVDLVSMSLNHIHVVYQDPNTQPIHVTGFYGYPEERNKSKSWELLQRIKGSVAGLWLCFGDFNALLSGSEKTRW